MGVPVVQVVAPPSPHGAHKLTPVAMDKCLEHDVIILGERKRVEKGLEKRGGGGFGVILVNSDSEKLSE